MKYLILFNVALVSLLCSCGFLLSPVGEELVVDAAEEAVKIEESLVKPKVPVSNAAPATPKE